jgi:hypothetical protein
LEQKQHGNIAVSGRGLRWPPSWLPLIKLCPLKIWCTFGGPTQISNLSLADTSVASGVHLPFTYNALRGLLLPSGFF